MNSNIYFKKNILKLESIGCWFHHDLGLQPRGSAIGYQVGQQQLQQQQQYESNNCSKSNIGQTGCGDHP